MNPNKHGNHGNPLREGSALWFALQTARRDTVAADAAAIEARKEFERAELRYQRHLLWREANELRAKLGKVEAKAASISMKAS